MHGSRACAASRGTSRSRIARQEVSVKFLKIALALIAVAAPALVVALFATAPSDLPGDTQSGRRLPRGPFAVALTEVEGVDGKRPTAANRGYAGASDRRLPAAIWYPVEAPGRHPLLVYNHGFMSSRYGGRYLAEHLA